MSSFVHCRANHTAKTIGNGTREIVRRKKQMSKITNHLIEQEEKYSDLYQECRDILQGKSDKVLTEEHQEAVEYEHRKLLNSYN